MIAEISFFYNSYLCLQKKWLHKTNTYMYSLLSHRSIIYTIQMNDICTYLNSFFNVIKKNLLYFFFIFVQTFFFTCNIVFPTLFTFFLWGTVVVNVCYQDSTLAVCCDAVWLEYSLGSRWRTSVGTHRYVCFCSHPCIDFK